MSELEPTRTYSNPTATDVLRRLLDERGVEWWQKKRHTCWKVGKGQEVEMWRAWEAPDGSLTLKVDYIYDLTPAQAIAATLSSCNCSNNCTNSERTGTCKVDVLNTGDCAGYECSEYIMHCNGCGHEFGHVLYSEDGDVWMSEPPNFCPNCGRRIEQ